MCVCVRERESCIGPFSSEEASISFGSEKPESTTCFFVDSPRHAFSCWYLVLGGGGGGGGGGRSSSSSSSRSSSSSSRSTNW